MTTNLTLSLSALFTLELNPPRLLSAFYCSQGSTFCASRYTVQEACKLLGKLGITNTGTFEENGVNGADLLDLDADDLTSHLHLTQLQVRK